MTADHITAFLLGATLASIAWHWGAEFAAWLATRRQAKGAPPAPATAAPAPAAAPLTAAAVLADLQDDDLPRHRRPSGATWSPMVCGTRLELGATGFWIAFRPRSADGCPFHGYSPEGRRLLWGHDLASMKRVLENMAAERAEFAPAPVLPRGETPGR